MSMYEEYVINSKGEKELMDFSRVDKKYKDLCFYPTKLNCDFNRISQAVRNKIVNLIQTVEIDIIAAEVAYTFADEYSDAAILARRIVLSIINKYVPSNMFDYVQNLSNYGICNDEFYLFVTRHHERLTSILDYKNNERFSFISLSTLIDKYLFKKCKSNTYSTNKKIEMYDRLLENPQQMWLRVAIALHMPRDFTHLPKVIHKKNFRDPHPGDDDYDEDEIFKRIEESYKNLSTGMYSLATPVLFNAGGKNESLLSCFLLGTNDSLEDILKTTMDASLISKHSGGIGLHMDVRCNGTPIKTTGGESKGTKPFLSILNEHMKHINQGGRRPGSAAIYLKPEHPDFMECTDINYIKGLLLFAGFWIHDEFMRRIAANEPWYFVNPHGETKYLYDLYGDEWTKAYNEIIAQNKYHRLPPGPNVNPDGSINAIHVMKWILKIQIETGKGYMLYCDAINKKSNQKNIGVIKCSNLCAEIVEYSDQNEAACCVLATVCLPNHVSISSIDQKPTLDCEAIIRSAELCARDLNRIIDINNYPIKEALYSNLKHRPIAIGCQGLADMFFKLDVPFESDEASKYNRMAFESIYYGSLKESNRLAILNGPYETFKGSPFSEGKLQYDLWGKTENDLIVKSLDWKQLKENIVKYGTINSLLTSCPPTATTALIHGNTECFEPITSNIYTRITGSGTYVIYNKYLIEDLKKYNLYSSKILSQLSEYSGSVQNLEIPQFLKDKYKIVTEMKNSILIDRDSERAPFIDQTMSSNRFMKTSNITMNTVKNMHMYCWKSGLKTGMYYLRQPEVEVPTSKIDLSNGEVKEVEVEEKKSTKDSKRFGFDENGMFTGSCSGGVCSV